MASIDLYRLVQILREDERETGLTIMHALRVGQPEIGRVKLAQLDAATAETMLIFTGVMSPKEAARKVGH